MDGEWLEILQDRNLTKLPEIIPQIRKNLKKI
jgi:hypothetical protein